MAARETVKWTCTLRHDQMMKIVCSRSMARESSLKLTQCLHLKTTLLVSRSREQRLKQETVEDIETPADGLRAAEEQDHEFTTCNTGQLHLAFRLMLPCQRPHVSKPPSRSQRNNQICGFRVLPGAKLSPSTDDVTVQEAKLLRVMYTI